MTTNAHRFRNVVVADRWGMLNREGVLFTDSSREADLAAHQGVPTFLICEIDDQRIAVFMRVRPERRANVVARAHDVAAAAVIFSDVGAETTVIEVEIGASTSPLERCAFAAAVAEYNCGNLAKSDRYEVRIRDRGIVDVTMDFDWDVGDEGAWFGEAHLRPES